MNKYGDKRDYPKIDIYVNGVYHCSTTWANTCNEAVKLYKEKEIAYLEGCDRVHAQFAIR